MMSQWTSQQREDLFHLSMQLLVCVLDLPAWQLQYAAALCTCNSYELGCRAVHDESGAHNMFIHPAPEQY